MQFAFNLLLPIFGLTCFEADDRGRRTEFDIALTALNIFLARGIADEPGTF
jgi:hypothetical protein